MDIKHTAFKLNKLLGKFILETPPHRRPLRSTDVEVRPVIKELQSSLGYKYFTTLLNDIIKAGCEDLLTNLYEKKELESGKTLWYFDLGKQHIKTQEISIGAENKNHNFQIDLGIADSSFFTKEERDFLTRHKKKLEDLINEKVESKTEQQEEFKTVVHDLLEKATEKTRPESYYERIISKYQLYILISN